MYFIHNHAQLSTVKAAVVASSTQNDVPQSQTLGKTVSSVDPVAVVVHALAPLAGNLNLPSALAALTQGLTLRIGAGGGRSPLCGDGATSGRGG